MVMILEVIIENVVVVKTESNFVSVCISLRNRWHVNVYNTGANKYNCLPKWAFCYRLWTLIFYLPKQVVVFMERQFRQMFMFVFHATFAFTVHLFCIFSISNPLDFRKMSSFNTGIFPPWITLENSCFMICDSVKVWLTFRHKRSFYLLSNDKTWNMC